MTTLRYEARICWSCCTYSAIQVLNLKIKLAIGKKIEMAAKIIVAQQFPSMRDGRRSE